MKLSAVFLLSVNVVAASQLAAQAADGSDTVSFLQDSLEQAKVAAPALPAPAKPSRLSHSAMAPLARSTQKLMPMTPRSDSSSRLRPFVAGRYLPSQSDLQPRSASEPQMPLAAPTLSGQVSTMYAKVPTTYASDYVDQLALAAARKVKNVAKKYMAASKAAPGAAAVLPGQYGAAAAEAPAVPALSDLIGAEQSAGLAQLPNLSQPVVPTPLQGAQAQLVVPQPLQSLPARSPAAQYIVPPPNLSHYEETRMVRQVEANLPERLYAQANGDMRATSRVNPGLTGAGPPPFPLSSLLGAGGAPGARSGRTRPAPGIEAKFGNWHGGNSLPSAAFHTYLSKARMAGPLSVSRSSVSKGSRRTGRQVAACHPGSATPAAPAHASSAAKTAKSATVKSSFVACYPQYRRFPSGG